MNLNHRLLLAALAAALLCLLSLDARAQDERTPSPAGPKATIKRKIIVGTKQAPPFSMKREDGTWVGISIDLWREIASDIGVDYELRETDLAGLVAGIKDHSLDAGVAALSVTAEREEVMDFTHPFYTTGLGIAVATKQDGGTIFSAVRRFVASEGIKVILGLFAAVAVAGFFMWLFERKANPEQFGGSLVQGVGEGFWFAAVTMTTVGYGDKSPRTRGGRLVAIVWMFASVVMISSFTAAIASVLTVNQLESIVRGPDDLPRVKVATVGGSTSSRYLESRHIGYSRYATVAEALAAVAEGKADAAVYDAPILTYVANTTQPGKLTVLTETFERQDYAIGLPEESPLRKPINTALLKRLDGPTWKDIKYRYLGGL